MSPRVTLLEGPEHFCQPLDVALQLRALRLQEAWERADPRDRWRHTGEPPPPIKVRNGPIETAPPRKPEPYRTPQSTINAFKYVVGLNDLARLKAWLVDHSRDAGFLLKLPESKQ